MSETLTHEQWLEFEISLDEEYVSKHVESTDPVERAQVERRRRDADAKRAELATVREAPHLALRLTGRAIETNNAPISLVKDLVSRLEVMAEEFGAELLVAPSSPGSHVIELAGPRERSLFLDGSEYDTDVPFGALARSLVDLAPKPNNRSEEEWEQSIQESAVELTDAALAAVRGLVDTLAKSHVNLDIRLTGRAGSAEASLSDKSSAFVHRVLNDVQREVQRVSLDGVLDGFTRGTGRFEITTTSGLMAGRVPRALRSAADGIEIGSPVVAEIDQTTTTLKSGGTRVSFRLVSLHRADR